MVRTSRLGVALAAVLMALTACSSSAGSTGGSAEAQVCAARATLSSSYQALVADVQALNLGNARNDLTAVKSALTGLGTAASALAAEKKVVLQPQVTALTSTLQGLEQTTTVAELGAGLETAKAQFTAILDTAASSAGCT